MDETLNPQISIIIPTLNEGKNLSKLISNLAAWRQLGDEVIVVDGGSTDDTVEQAQTADTVIRVGRGRGIQMNKGARIGRGRILLFLHADSKVQFFAREDILSSCNKGSNWGYFGVRIDGTGLLFRIIERGMSIRSRWTGIATGDQGIFVTKDLFARAGGFKNIPLMEDIDLSERLCAQERPAVCRTVITTSARRWKKGGILRTILMMWCLRLAWFFGMSPTKLARIYGYK